MASRGPTLGSCGLIPGEDLKVAKKDWRTAYPSNNCPWNSLSLPSFWRILGMSYKLHLLTKRKNSACLCCRLNIDPCALTYNRAEGRVCLDEKAISLLPSFKSYLNAILSMEAWYVSKPEMTSPSPNLSACFALLKTLIAFNLVLGIFRFYLPGCAQHNTILILTINKISSSESNTFQIAALNVTCSSHHYPLIECVDSAIYSEEVVVAFDFFVQQFVLNLELLRSAWDLLWPPHLYSEVMGKGHILWGNIRADGTRNWKKM